MASRPMPYRLNGLALSLSKAPYNYSFVPERPVGTQWRIRDSRDDPVGSAGTEAGARTAVRRLNGGGAQHV